MLVVFSTLAIYTAMGMIRRRWPLTDSEKFLRAVAVVLFVILTLTSVS